MRWPASRRCRAGSAWSAHRRSISRGSQSELEKKSAALGISRFGGARNPHVFQYTLRFPRSGGTRPSFARDGFFTNSHGFKPRKHLQWQDV
ncbi:MAG: hypothetical protein ACREYE_08435 [Gammaproteobacteria bacterium]